MPVPPGELIDRITILKVKLLYIKDQKKAANVKKYLTELQNIRKKTLAKSARLKTLEKELLALNKNQWELEDQIRLRLKKIGADQTLGHLVLRMHESNNKRASLKRKIDEYLKSDFLDEKKYA